MSKKREGSSSTGSSPSGRSPNQTAATGGSTAPVDERTRLNQQFSRPPYLRQLSNIEANNTSDAASTGSGSVSQHLEEVEIPQQPNRRVRPTGRTYWAYYIPALKWVPHYRLSYLFGDVCAGLTIASYQIPISIAYASSLAHVPTVSGLYGLVVPPLIYSILGSVPQMVVGPEGPISLIVGQAVTPYIHHHGHGIESKLSPSQVTGIIAGGSGAVLLSAGLLRFGFLDSVLSKALLRGFISAVGLVMVLDQIPTVLGLEDLMHKVTETHPSSVGKVVFIFNYFHETHPLTAKLGISAFIIILALRFTKQKYSQQHKALVFLPEILLAVITFTIICDYFDLDQDGVNVVGKIKPGRVNIDFPFTPEKWPDFKSNFSAAFFAAILGFFESTVAAKALGSAYDVNVSTNRELVALGVVNLVSCLVSSLPSFGGYARSKVNALSGAKTQMSAIILSIVTMLCILFAMPYFYYLPDTVLAAVTMVIGISLLEEAPNDIRFYWKVRGYHELFTLFLTLTSTVFWSVQTGIAVGVGLSLVRVIHHATRPRIQILGRIPGTNTFRNADEFPDSLEAIPGCLIIKIPEPLTFANTGDLRNRLRRLEFYGSMKVHPGFPRLLHEFMSQYIIIDLRGMTECDSSAVQILYELFQNYIKKNITILFVRMPQDPSVQKQFERAGIKDLITQQDILRHNNNTPMYYFESIHEALNLVDSNV